MRKSPHNKDHWGMYYYNDGNWFHTEFKRLKETNTKGNKRMEKGQTTTGMMQRTIWWITEEEETVMDDWPIRKES